MLEQLFVSVDRFSTVLPGVLVDTVFPLLLTWFIFCSIPQLLQLQQSAVVADAATVFVVAADAAFAITYCCCCLSFRHDDGARLEEQLQLRHLEQLRYWFENHRSVPRLTDDTEPCPAYQQCGRLSRDDFKQVIAMVIGSHDYDHQLDSLFTKVREHSDFEINTICHDLLSYFCLCSVFEFAFERLFVFVPFLTTCPSE